MLAGVPEEEKYEEVGKDGVGVGCEVTISVEELGQEVFRRSTEPT